MRSLLITLFLGQLCFPMNAAELPDGWFTDWDHAIAQAKSSEKPMFVMFSAPWCASCQMMVKNIYPKGAVQKEFQNWVPVYVDVDKYAKYRPLEQYVEIPFDEKKTRSKAGVCIVNVSSKELQATTKALAEKMEAQRAETASTT